MEALYNRYSSLVYSVAMRVVGDATVAEDILQDVFMQVWLNPRAFDATRGNSMGAWFAAISRNRAIDSLRRRRTQTDIEGIVVSAEFDLASETERKRLAVTVRKILADMSEPQRTALEMSFFQGLTHTEIAARTGEPVGTIKSRIRSGLLALRRGLKG